jgi:uncharacterized phiE125 gp8 family phage protein
MIRVIIEPTTEPITAADVVEHSRITETEPSVIKRINRAIKAARKQAENELGRKLITQTVDITFDNFPAVFYLMPVQSVVSITYLDAAGLPQTLASNQYTVDAKSIPARITPSYGSTWPTVRGDVNSVTIRCIAGYGSADAVPECIKDWMLLKIDDDFEHRGSIIVGASVNMMNHFASARLDSERVYGPLT